MTARTEMIETLKQSLRSRHVTYSDIGQHLDLSEANIKNMFASGRFTLERLEKICELVNMDLLDLMHQVEANQHRISYLSREQEEELVADIRLVLVAVCVRDHLSFEEILALFDLSEAECIRSLARLDKLGVIDLLPGNRIKLRIKEDFRWIANGPIEKFFEKHVLNEFLQSRFSHAGEFRQFSSGMLTEASSEILLRKIESLIKDFSSLHLNDCDRPYQDRKNIGMLVALRPWRLKAFNQLKN